MSRPEGPPNAIPVSFEPGWWTNYPTRDEWVSLWYEDHPEVKKAIDNVLGRLAGDLAERAMKSVAAVLGLPSLNTLTEKPINTVK